MNKSDLIEQLTEKTKKTHKQIEEVVNLIFDSLTHALVKGERIEIRGFGSFVSNFSAALRADCSLHLPSGAIFPECAIFVAVRTLEHK